MRKPSSRIISKPMKNFIFICTIVLLGGCATTSKLETLDLNRKNNKDVFILSNLIQEHLMRTNDFKLDLDALVQSDTLKRISHHFEDVKLEFRGGHIAIYYVFAKTRNTAVELTSEEQEKLSYRRFVVDKIDAPYDGEIRLAYGEKFYHHIKVILNEDT